jgi:hypothetical protein
VRVLTSSSLKTDLMTTESVGVTATSLSFPLSSPTASFSLAREAFRLSEADGPRVRPTEEGFGTEAEEEGESGETTGSVREEGELRGE